MVSITSITGSTDGVIFEELKRSSFKRVRPRVTKSRTLDGGVYVDHRGVVDGDREFEIEAILDEATATALQNIHENESLVHIACLQGFYTGAISFLEIDNGFLRMTFWVSDQVAVSSTTVRFLLNYESISLTESVNLSVA